MWQQREPISQVSGELIPEIRLNQIMHGERFGFGRPSAQNLSPQAFPTESAFSSALRLSAQVERLQR
ncbi:MAG TPA: hypothetical protein VGF67_07445 [Ktedonobacteraceae bacterium]|jgi:hypothetical protein